MEFTDSRRSSKSSMRGARSRLVTLLTACVLAAIIGGCGSRDQAGTPPEFQETASGLKYRIRREGTGPYPQVGNLLRVHYRGWLEDGSVFDTTYTSGESAALFLDKTIAGWQEGVPLCREGGAIELVVPPELGYGPEGNSMIPPNATLYFLIEVEQVIR